MTIPFTWTNNRLEWSRNRLKIQRGKVLRNTIIQKIVSHEQKCLDKWCMKLTILRQCRPAKLQHSIFPTLPLEIRWQIITDITNCRWEQKTQFKIRPNVICTYDEKMKERMFCTVKHLASAKCRHHTNQNNVTAGPMQSRRRHIITLRHKQCAFSAN